MWRKHLAEIGWGLFSGLCLIFVASVAHWETIPFHLVWLGLAIVYGVHRWELGTALAVLAAVIVFSGAALLITAQQPGGPGLDELAEVPMMAAMFAAMVWYTERAKHAMASQRQVLEREREFVRDASHELKTPITVARGHAELIRASAPTGQIEDDADIVLDELSRLTRIADRLLLLMAAEHPDFLHVKEVSVDALMEQIARRWTASADRHWEVHSAAPGLVAADLDRLELAMDSLIENAVRFTGHDDTIAVTARSEAGTLVLSVADSGAGIPQDQLVRIFDRFARVDPDRGRGSGGTGLGLAIVRAIADAHGGSVGVTSDPDLGSTFSLRIPGYRAAERPLAHHPRPAVLDPTA
jgi:two-component system OmpR family sensor kinase